jgi:hypothetical protein
MSKSVVKARIIFSCFLCSFQRLGTPGPACQLKGLNTHHPLCFAVRQSPLPNAQKRADPHDHLPGGKVLPGRALHLLQTDHLSLEALQQGKHEIDQ